MVDSIEITPEPKLSPQRHIDKSLENIKKLKDLEHKEKLEADK